MKKILFLTIFLVLSCESYAGKKGKKARKQLATQSELEGGALARKSQKSKDQFIDYISKLKRSLVAKGKKGKKSVEKYFTLNLRTWFFTVLNPSQFSFINNSEKRLFQENLLLNLRQFFETIEENKLALFLKGEKIDDHTNIFLNKIFRVAQDEGVDQDGGLRNDLSLLFFEYDFLFDLFINFINLPTQKDFFPSLSNKNHKFL